MGNWGGWNSGMGSTGFGNSGVTSTGFWNSGSYDTGFGNAGSGNAGAFNAGSHNTGWFNSGSGSTGDYNSGDGNFGSFNAGDVNTGSFNAGSVNTGLWNSGHTNTGALNSGTLNTGFGSSIIQTVANSGFGNTGTGNSGFNNFGDNNSGYGNAGVAGGPGQNNAGIGNQGTLHSGIGNTGSNNDSGFGNTGFYNVGFFNTGDNNSGFGNINDVASGFNSGIGNFGNSNSGASISVPVGPASLVATSEVDRASSERKECDELFGFAPEINSAQIYAGPGSAPMLQAAASWQRLADELTSAAASFESVTEALVGDSWQGWAAAAMASAAAPYASWLNAAAAGAQSASVQAGTAATVFEDALAAIVHPAVVATNRNQLVMLAMSNLFGLNAPAIAATEAHYEQMWAQDVAALSGYHAGVSTVAAQLAPWQGVLQTLQGNASSSIAAVNLAAQAESSMLWMSVCRSAGCNLCSWAPRRRTRLSVGWRWPSARTVLPVLPGCSTGPGPWAAPPAPAVVAFSTRRWPWATPAPHRPAACLPWPRPSVAATLSAPVVM
ncbi:hypothetical protein NIIDMKKI_56010 [Mycobacterium kansasii]|uniref:PPE domain-containing protein n=1 Tax=Mycobacterium kansasii TaxID=1768 RepID=A0A7G1IKY8_MYCKA|nr:hypothetical protein NIIDMKKI_56010 [Mycobacterium kansasii]